jgi:pimeloyl-ACP methyl ester carboxylesterase
MTAGGKIKKDGMFLLMATRAQTPSAGYADLPGVRLVRLWYTNSGGSGVPVVLLHANTGNADSWEYNIPGFVEAGYWVIVTFDRRGWGRSKYIGQDLTRNLTEQTVSGKSLSKLGKAIRGRTVHVRDLVDDCGVSILAP